MARKITMSTALAAGAALSSQAGEASPLDKAFEALKSYKWGTERSVLKPIDDAVAGSYKKPEERKKLELRLASLLKEKLPDAAKDYICRKLRLIGTAACVPFLAPVLRDEKLSHMARYALERIPGPEAVAAMREAVGDLTGRRKIGCINSLGVRRDQESIGLLKKLLDDSDPGIAGAAAAALGAVGNSKAKEILLAYAPKAPEKVRPQVADALLVCAEHLAEAGRKEEALAVYTELTGRRWPRLIRKAALRGISAVRKK